MSHDTRAAREDLKKINEILDRRGGFSEADEGKTVEIEIRLLVEEKQYRSAKERLIMSQFLPSRVRARLTQAIARAVSFEQSGVDSVPREWAKRVQKT